MFLLNTAGGSRTLCQLFCKDKFNNIDIGNSENIINYDSEEIVVILANFAKFHLI